MYTTELTDAEIDKIYDDIDTLLCDGEFELVNKYLNPDFHISRDIDYLITILTITLAAKSKLPNRKLFFDETLKYCSRQLLSGLI